MEKKDIEKLAQLARIELGDAEKEALRVDTEKILEFVGQIQNVEVSLDGEARTGVPRNIFRADGDAHERGIYTDVLLNGAPDQDRGYVKVQKIL